MPFLYPEEDRKCNSQSAVGDLLRVLCGTNVSIHEIHMQESHTIHEYTQPYQVNHNNKNTSKQAPVCVCVCANEENKYACGFSVWMCDQ